MQVRRVASVAVAVAIAAACSGCGSDAGGYESTSVGMLEVDHPAAWTTSVAVRKPWTKGFRRAKDSVEQMQVSGDLGGYSSATEAMGVLMAYGNAGLDGFHVEKTRDVEVDGATSAEVARFTITDDKGAKVHGEWFVAVKWPGLHSVGVSTLSRRADPGLEKHVLSSMRMHVG